MVARIVEPAFAGIVSAASPEAAAAGIEILEMGGNAVDAAVAVSLALGVTEPACSGLGGQSMVIVHPHRGSTLALNGTSYAPGATPLDIRDPEALRGHRATTIPSTVRVLQYAWKHYRLVWISEALRVGHTHRRHAPVPDLLNYERAVARKLRKETARQLYQSVAHPGTGETTHFSIVDRQGMGVGVTQSINSFYGAKVASPELGFPYNDYMNEFVLNMPNHPYALRPKAMPYSSMSATILSRDGEVGMVVGSPGSERIISAVVQVISNWVDAGMDIEAAVSAPRLHFVPEDELYIEFEQRPAALINALQERGFRIVEPESGLREGNLDPYFGGVHAIAHQPSGWHGAADPRRDGVWLRQ